MAGGNEHVTTLEFPSVRLSHGVGEVLVVIDEEVEVVIHELEWAMNDVPEQHGAMDPLRDDDDRAPWSMSWSKTHIDPGQQCAVALPRLDTIEYRAQPFGNSDRSVYARSEEVLFGSWQEMVEVSRRASNGGVREIGGTPGQCGRNAGG